MAADATSAKEGSALDMSALRAAIGDEEKALDSGEGLDFSKMKKKKKETKKAGEDRPAQATTAQTEPDYTYTEVSIT